MCMYAAIFFVSSLTFSQSLHVRKGTIIPYEPDAPMEEERPGTSSNKRSRTTRSGNGNVNVSPSHGPSTTTTAMASAAITDILQHDLCKYSLINGHSQPQAEPKEAIASNSSSSSSHGGLGNYPSRAGTVKRTRNETLLESVLAQTAAEPRQPSEENVFRTFRNYFI